MKKGISLTALGIVIIILGLLSAVAVINGKEYIEDVKKSKFLTDYMLVESAVRKYYDENEKYPILTDEKGNNKSKTLVANFSSEKTQFGSYYSNALSRGIKLDLIDIELLGYDELTTGIGRSDNDYYGVYSDGQVYYIKGFKYNNKVYYKVVDELK